MNHFVLHEQSAPKGLRSFDWGLRPRSGSTLSLSKGRFGPRRASLRVKAGLLALVCAIAGTSAVAADASGAGAENLAVLDFKPNNASAGDASTISEFVRAAFVKSGSYKVVDKANMERILAEQAFQQTGCTDSTCAVKLGKMLNVRKMIVGNYSLMGTVRFLTASLVDVETGGIERTGKVKGFELGNADEAADDLVRQLIGVAQPVRPEVASVAPGPAVEDAQAKVRAEEARRKAEAEAVQAAAREAARKEKERLKAERAAARALEPVDFRVARGRIGVGLNYPGLGVRALIGNRWMVEARGQYEKEARAAGGRLYLYVFPGGGIYPYLGVEGDYIKTLGEGLYAAGYLGEAFAGLEYFIFRSLSLQFDFGPAYAALGEGGVSVTGIRYAVNFGLTLYF
jgi:hypothetical protein